MNEKDICTGECYGCTSCFAICPKSAIIMKENKKGFLEPVINSELCIDCGLCQKVCKEKNLKKNVKSFIGKYKDAEMLKASQSGGAASAISDIILDENGVVYGASLDENFEAVHVRISDKKELYKIKGSKYVQSRLENTFKNVEEDLATRPVLFTGTPCQVNGLLSYLKTKNVSTNNLYTIDLICHGVPSVLIWRKLLKYYINKFNNRICSVNFRDKNVGGWENSFTSILFSDKKVIDRYYGKIFYSCLALRDSCYKCEYARMERPGDFTVSDAWGVKKHDEEFYDKNGVSLIMFNSDKALSFYQKISEQMHLKEVNIEDYKQGNLEKPTQANRNVDEFWSDFDKKDFRYIIKKYAENNILLNYKYALSKSFSKFKRLK